MKRLALALLACGAIAAQDLELTDAARQISAEFRKKNPALDFRSTLAVAKFKTASERLQKNATAELVKAAFEKEFVRSVYFEVVERENLDKVIAEIELRQKGLTQTKSSDDALRGAEHLLVGELAEDAGNLVITARLVQAVTGTVVATAQVRAPLDNTERAAEAFRFSAFQSQYGITLGLDASVVRPRGETTTSPSFVTGFVAYRVARPLRLGAGFANLNWNDFFYEDVPASTNNMNHKRRYSLSGTGPRLFFDLLWAVHPRLNLGARGDVTYLPGIRLEQDVAEIKAWDYNASTGATEAKTQRVLVNSTSKAGMTIFRPAILAEFLISNRLSCYISAGYMFSTRFSPDTYEANGERNWGGNSDGNGTFAKYANYDFAKRGDGRPVEMQMGFVFFDVGLSLHF
ncbi:MAG: FlgO family outer membrane protein [Spirochaetota bacterium]